MTEQMKKRKENDRFTDAQRADRRNRQRDRISL